MSILSSAPTLDEVAQTAGVSRSTASRAINGGLRVSPEAQAAVDAAVAQLGYRSEERRVGKECPV